MALKPKGLYIAFDNGLDTYSNPHTIVPGKLTAASGVSMDRPGYVYPGPTLGANVATGALYQGAIERYGLAAYTASQPTIQDTVLAWTAQANGTFPVRPVEDNLSPNLIPSLFPLRQSTQQVVSTSQFSAFFNALVSIGVPVASTGLAGTIPVVAYAWVSLGATKGIYIVRQNIATGNIEPVRTLNPVNDTLSIVATGTGSYVKVALCSDSGGTLYMIAVLATSFKVYSITGGFGNPVATLISTVASGLCSVDACSSIGTSNAYVAYIQSGAGAGVYGTSFSNGAVVAGPTAVIVGTDPNFSFATPSTNFPIACWLDDSNLPNVAVNFGVSVALTAVGSPVTIVTAISTLALVPAPTITYIPARLVVGVKIPQIAVVPTFSVATGQMILNFAYEPAALDASYLGGNSYVQLDAVNSVTGALVSSILFGQFSGGAALAGKGSARVGSAQLSVAPQDVVFPIRTGWYAQPGASPIAYPNAYLVDMRALPVAKWADADYGTPTTWPRFTSGYITDVLPVLSQPVRLTSDAQADHTTAWPWPQLNFAVSISTSLNPPTFGIPSGTAAAVALVKFTRISSQFTTLSSRQLGNTTILAGSLTSYYDGSNVIEAGFLTRGSYPTSISSGGSIDYYYIIVFSYSDAAGRQHYSAPSLPCRIPGAAPSPGSQFAILPPPTIKANGMTLVNVLIYRTLGAPGAASASSIPYYLVTTPIALQTGSVGIPFTDTFSDATISQNTTLYTYGQAINASAGTKAPPPFDSVTSWQNAFWGVCNRNGPELWFTWPLDNGAVAPEAPSWSSANRVPLPADLGQPLAIVGLDSNLIIFGTNADYALTGSLPQRNSSLADEPGLLSAPTKLPTPGGMKIRNGITFLPTGILFQGTQGFTLLDRSLSYQPVGVAVRNFTNTGIYGPGVLYPEQGCCILPPADGISPPLTYYYFEGKWSSPAYTPAGVLAPGAAPSAPSLRQWQAVSGAVRSRLTQGAPQIVSFEPDVTKPGLNVLQPGGGYLQARTPWIEMEQSSVVGSDIASVAGFGQLEEIQIQGDLLSQVSHTVTLLTEYDYAGNTQTPPDTQVITNVVPQVGPSSAPSNPDWQFRLGFKTTLVRRVRFTLTFQVTDMAVLAAGDPVVLISGLMLYYGVDDGLSRMGSSGAGYGS